MPRSFGRTRIALLVALWAMTTIGVAGAPPPSATDATDTVPRARSLVKLGSDRLRIRSGISNLKFTADGKRIVATGINLLTPQAWVFDVATGGEVQYIHPEVVQPSGIHCLTLSPDQTKLLWGELEGHVAIWDLAQERLLHREKVYQRNVKDVVFSPDGRMFAHTGDNGDQVQLAVLEELGQPPKVFSIPDVAAEPGGNTRTDEGKSRSVNTCCLAFTPDSSRLVCGTTLGDIFVWKVADRTLVSHIRRAHGRLRESINPSLTHLAILPDGREIVSFGQRTIPRSQSKLELVSTDYVQMSEVRFWDCQTGQPLRAFAGEQDFGFGYGNLSADGTKVAVADFSLLRIIDAQNCETLQSISLPGSWGHQPDFSADGKLVALPMGNAIGLFETATGRRLLHDADTPTGEIASADWSPDGKRIVTGHADGGLRVWDAQSGKLIWHEVLAPVISRSGWEARPWFVTFSPDGKWVVAAGRRDDPVRFEVGIVAIHDAADGRKIRTCYLDTEVQAGALSPDGTLIMVATCNGSLGETRIHGIDTATGETVLTFPPVKTENGLWDVNLMRFQANSMRLRFTSGNGEIHSLDLITDDHRQFLADWRSEDQKAANNPSRPDLSDADFAADGQTLVSSTGHNVYVWDTHSGELRRTILHPHEHGCHIRLAPDGRSIATSDRNYVGDPGTDAIRLYDLETGRLSLLAEPGAHRATVLVFSPDGKRLFTGYYGGTAEIWEISQ